MLYLLLKIIVMVLFGIGIILGVRWFIKGLATDPEFTEPDNADAAALLSGAFFGAAVTAAQTSAFVVEPDPSPVDPSLIIPPLGQTWNTVDTSLDTVVTDSNNSTTVDETPSSDSNVSTNASSC